MSSSRRSAQRRKEEKERAKRTNRLENLITTYFRNPLPGWNLGACRQQTMAGFGIALSLPFLHFDNVNFAAFCMPASSRFNNLFLSSRRKWRKYIPWNEPVTQAEFSQGPFLGDFVLARQNLLAFLIRRYTFLNWPYIFYFLDVNLAAAIDGKYIITIELPACNTTSC